MPVGSSLNALCPRTHSKDGVSDICWALSMYLEAVAMLPQVRPVGPPGRHAASHMQARQPPTCTRAPDLPLPQANRGRRGRRDHRPAPDRPHRLRRRLFPPLRARFLVRQLPRAHGRDGVAVAWVPPPLFAGGALVRGACLARLGRMPRPPRLASSTDDCPCSPQVADFGAAYVYHTLLLSQPVHLLAGLPHHCSSV